MLVPTFVFPPKPANYEAWKISFGIDGTSATARRKINGSVTEVALKSSSLGIPFEGWYGGQPHSAKKAIGGACTLCECFVLELAGMYQRTAAPLFLSPCNHHDFLSIERYMQQEEHIIAAAHLPMGLCVYHTSLVSAQAQIAKQEGVAEMVYHIPRKEYHHYHGNIERLVGTSLPGIHRYLDWYSDMLERYVRETFQLVGVGVRIIDPFQPGMDPNDAYVLPYAKPQMFGLDPEHTMGVEDLVELRLAVEAEKKGWHAFPVWVGVLGLPDSPYRQRGVARTKRFPLDYLAR